MRTNFISYIIIILFIPFLWKGQEIVAQNVAITDDDTYNADNSAMLDVKSLTKGMLVPRLTTLQRLAIVSPATGLLVYDSSINQFLYYNGTTWLNLLTPEGDTLWNVGVNTVSLANPLWNMGVGSTNPVAKLEVKGDSLAGIDDPLFAVVNKNGDTIFAVYQGGVRIYVQDDPAKATGSKGGFAVGGFSPAKGAVTNEYLRITPDSIRMYVDDDPLVKATGSKGGFAVGGFSPAKAGLTNEYLRITPDSVRIYIEESGAAKATGSKGGFAVGGFSPAKAGLTNEYLRITNDSTRIYTQDTIKGFGVKNIGATSTTSYMQLTPSNYFIGHESGISNTTGLYNSFMGYQAGKQSSSGSSNIFIGYLSGNSNTVGYENVFLGNKCGFSNLDGNRNVFVGFESGLNNMDGWYNAGCGYQALFSNIGGSANVALGQSSLYSNTEGQGNVALGYMSMYSNKNANSNIAIGLSALYTQSFDDGSGFNWPSNNIAIGEFALFSNQPTSTSNGILNIAIGKNSLRYNLTGYRNISLGHSSLLYNTTGYYNTSVGYSSLQANTTGYSNVSLGYLTLYFNNIGTQNTAIGSRAGITSNVTNANYSGSNNTFIGYNSGPASVTQRNNATALGYNALVDCDNCLTLGGTGADAVNVGIRTTTPGYPLEVNGNARINGNLKGNAGPSGLGASLADRNNDNNISFDWDGGTLRFWVDVTNVKNFIIDNPVDKNKYLVHTTLEGPENGVYYRGTAKLENGKAVVELPEYFDALTQNNTATVILTPKGKIPFLLSYDEFNETTFAVYGNITDGEFDWEVKAQRQDVPNIIVEPFKNEITVYGDGPYKYYSVKRNANIFTKYNQFAKN